MAFVSLQELDTGWTSTSTVTSSVSQPTLLAVPSIITQQPSNTVPSSVQAVSTVPVQLKSRSAIVTSAVSNQSKQDTSSK